MCLSLFEQVDSFNDTFREVHFCHSLKVAFLHIYKNGGSFMGGIFKAFCPRNVTKCASYNAKHNDNPFCDLNISDYADYRFYTFVRDPISRFASGVYELGVRRTTKFDQRQLFKML